MGAPPDNDPLIGASIGSYRVVRVLGDGGMGVVYEIVHPGIQKRLALKLLHTEYAARPEIVARFFDEARAVNLIGHPNIVDIIDFSYLGDGRPYITMEFLDGISLADLIRERGCLDAATATTITDQLCSALGSAHRAGIVHRDLKPDNIQILSRPGQPLFVKVLDFGIAKLRADLKATSSQNDTLSGVILGTPVYMSPEQASGESSRIDHRTDIYSLGIIIYQMLTGQPPFSGDTFAELLMKHMTSPPPRPTSQRADLGAGWDRVIARALAKEPESRFPDTETMATEIASLGGRETSLRAHQRQPRWLPLAIAAALVVAAGATALVVALREPGSSDGAAVGGGTAIAAPARAGESASPRGFAPTESDTPVAFDASTPAASSPDAAARAEAEPARSSASRRGTGTVNITADPWARVYVDGRRRGTTPLTLELSTGRHRIKLVNESLGTSDRQRIKVRAGKRIDVRANWD